MVERRRAWQPSTPWDSTHGRTTSGVALHHHLWAAHTVELRRAWHAIIAFGQHKRSNDVERGMPSSPLGSTHGRTTSGMACHNRLKAAHTVERRRAWHDITAFGQHHGRTTPGVTCHHSPWTANTVDDIRRGMPSSPLGSRNGRTMSGVACHHSP